jgi:hypothetical protein
MCCFFDTNTRTHSFLNALTDRDYLTTVFKNHPIDLIVMEACGRSGWINDLAVGLGLKTLVCSTNEDAWKCSNVMPLQRWRSSSSKCCWMGAKRLPPRGSQEQDVNDALKWEKNGSLGPRFLLQRHS